MSTKRCRLLLLGLAVAGLLAACGPEATRTRSGGRGADVGNYNGSVQIHGGAEPYYDTPQEPDAQGQTTVGQ